MGDVLYSENFRGAERIWREHKIIIRTRFHAVIRRAWDGVEVRLNRGQLDGEGCTTNRRTVYFTPEGRIAFEHRREAESRARAERFERDRKAEAAARARREAEQRRREQREADEALRAFMCRRSIEQQDIAFAALGLSPSASRAAIMKAFRQRALKCHPDHGGDAAAFRELCAAKERALEMLEQGVSL